MKFMAGTFQSIHQGEDHYPVVDGVVDCPMAIGRELGLEPVTDVADAPKSEDPPKAKGKGK